MLVPATPPPTMTTRARSSATSSGTSRGLEPIVEAGVRHRGREPIEVLPGVLDVVDVERREALLDDAPHRLPEVRHDPHQLQTGAMPVGRLPEVQGEQPLLRIVG